MKKLFTLIAAAVMTLAASAQTVVYDYKTSVGTTTMNGTTDNATVKINENKTVVNGIKFNNGLNSSNTTEQNYAKITPATGGFKEGDVISITGVYNNTDEKAAAVAIAASISTESSIPTTPLFTTENFINGRLIAENPTAQIFTLQEDCEALYLYREGKTGTFVIDLTVTRPESGPKANITLTYEKEGAIEFGYLTSDNSPLMVDFGDGTPTEMYGTKGDFEEYYTVEGETTGTVVKIYNDNVTLLNVGYVASLGNHLTALDVTNAANLQDLSANTNLLTALDVTKNPELTKIVVNGNQIAAIDVTNCTKLVTLNINDNAVEALDLSKCVALTTLNANNNKIAAGPVWGAAARTIKTVYLNNNGLSGEFDATIFPLFAYNAATPKSSVGNLYLNDNKLTSIKVSDAGLAYLYCMRNNLKISTMPTVLGKVRTFSYVPQNAMEVEESVNGSIDLSSEADGGNTTYAVFEITGTAFDAADYTVENGVITFGENVNGKSVYVAMTSATYANFKATNTLKTTPFTVNVATGINAISNVAAEGISYNLAGQRVNANAKGIVIMNGKKTLNR